MKPNLVLVPGTTLSGALLLCLCSQTASAGDVPAAPELPDEVTAEDWAKIQRTIAADRHAFEAAALGHTAFNPGLQFAAEFDGSSALIEPAGGGWQFGLALQSYRFEEHMTEVDRPTFGTCARAQALTYSWTEELDEWWINDSRGFEHGFTVSERPAVNGAAMAGGMAGAMGPLTLTLDVLGTLNPKVNSARTGLLLVGEKGVATLRYDGLFAFDANGAALNAWLEVEGRELRICVDESGATYPIVVDPVVQAAYLKASATDPFDNFGGSIAISGDTIVVGSRFEDSGATGVNGNDADNSAARAGAAYVFVRSAGSWVQEAYLKASNTDAGDQFGTGVAISGDTIVVGAWSEDSGAAGVNGDETDNSMFATGAAYVFTRTSGSWTQQAYLKASSPGALDYFGISVGIAGDTIVVGAEREDSGATGVDGDETNDSATQAGAAYVFFRSGSTWAQQAYLKASNTDAGDEFGCAVAIEGDTVAVASFFEASGATGVNGNEFDNSAIQAGAVYVFTRTGSAWSQQAYLKASNTGAVDAFGCPIDISGDTLVVGAFGEDSNATGVNGDETNDAALDSGAAYVFVRSGNAWSQQAYLQASNTDARDRFGNSVAISGNTLLVGAPAEDSSSIGIGGDQNNDSAESAGAVYTFLRSSSFWTQQEYVKASNTDAGDVFGIQVAIAGDIAAASAVLEESSATGVNGDENDNSMSGSGAVYVFDGIGPPGIGTTLCQGQPNSTGERARLSIAGSAAVVNNNITLEASKLPPTSFGYFITSTGTGVINNPAGSAGNVCIVSSDLGRYVNSIQNSGSAGFVSLPIDLTMVPSASGFVQALSSETRYFQYWHRDVDAASSATSNFSSAQGLTFQ